MEKVKEILAKETLTGEDITFLMTNQSFLRQEDLVRLGLVQAPPISVVEEPIVEKPVLNDEPVVPTIRRGRPKKIIN